MHAGEDAAAPRLDHDRAAMMAVEAAAAIGPGRAGTVALEDIDPAQGRDQTAVSVRCRAG